MSCLPERLTFKKVNYISYFLFQSYRQPYQPFNRNWWSWWSSSRQSCCITLFSVSCCKSEVVNNVMKWCIFNDFWLVCILRASFLEPLEAYYECYRQGRSLLLVIWAMHECVVLEPQGCRQNSFQEPNTESLWYRIKLSVPMISARKLHGG